MPRIYESTAGSYHRSQADAGKGATPLDIGTDKDSIIAALSAARAAGSGGQPETRAEPAIDTPAEMTPAGPTNRDIMEQAKQASERFAKRLNVTAIETWILDEATQPQIEQLFARLGARFAEARK